MVSTSQPLSAYSADTCMFCHQSLCITTSADTDSEPEDLLGQGDLATVIDDVELYCGPPGSGPGGHHAHWTCLIDHAIRACRTRGFGPMPCPGSADPPAFTSCAVCGQNVLDPSGRFIVDVQNEGGETRGFDFGAIIEEEVFLDANPSQVRNRAFHDFVAEGDYAAARKLVEDGVDIDCTYGTDGLTALQKAVFSGDVSGVEFLRDLGATV